MGFNARKLENGSLVVNEDDIVIVSNKSTKKEGYFARVSTALLTEGNVSIGFRSVIPDKSKHRVTVGQVLPNISKERSALLVGKPIEQFREGEDFTVSVPNKIDKLRYTLGRKLLNQ